MTGSPREPLVAGVPGQHHLPGAGDSAEECPESERFLGLTPGVEKAMADDGILLLKYWLEVSAGEQTRRLESRINDPRKIWKLSDMDLKSYRRWYDYSRARDAMFAATDTAWGPWYIAHTDRPPRHHAAQTPAPQRVPRPRPATALHPGTVLDGHAQA